MSDRVWHKGPPPFPGWWEASFAKEENVWRWWDGKYWSTPAWPEMSAHEAAYHADRKSGIPDHCWTDYWPENARVPRLDPTGGHWTFNVDGKRPKGLPVRIDLVFRNGQVVRGRPFPMLIWWRAGVPGDILAWRPAA